MTCAHVLGLIDADRFADYSQAHLDAAWQHAHQCATCGPALNAAAALTRDLAALPQPGPPPGFAATVLARLAHVEQAQHGPVAVAPAATTPNPMPRDWSASAGALGGLAAGLVVVLPTLADGVRIGMMSPRVGGVTGVLAMPSTITGALVLGAGLMLYAAGLFAPLRGRS
jgi:hypothetical protein